jgi:hypothetical protein
VLLLYFDILGYSHLAKTRGPEEVMRLLRRAEAHVDAVAKSQGLDRFIMSDTYLFWRDAEGATPRQLVELISAGLGFLMMSLGTRIPVRGALSKGSLLKRSAGPDGGSLIGSALVNAHELDRGHNLITLIVAQDVAKLIDRSNDLRHRWVRNPDGTIVCNPLLPLLAQVGDAPVRQSISQSIVTTGSLLALRYLLDQQDSFVGKGDFASREAQKYLCTLALARIASGDSRYKEAEEAARGIPANVIDRWLGDEDERLARTEDRIGDPNP